MVFIISRVLPAYADIFLYFGTELPLLTRLLLQLGKGAANYWHLVLASLALGFLAARQFLRSAPGKKGLDKLLVQVPVYGELYRKVVVARFARILGILLTSGVNLLSSLELAEYSVGNTLYALFIHETRANIRRGHGLAEMMAGSRLFPKMAVEMLAIGEQTGTLEGMLHKIADFTEGEIKYAVDRASSLIEPVLILVLAIFVGVIALSVFLPMFDMFELVR
jgi:type IV pilus assembly protein PilC